MRRIRQTIRCSLLLGALLSTPLMAQVSDTTMNTPYGEVSISRDAFNNPDITGTNELAVSWVQGYLHADDRFFQMDFNRRVASGRVAELVGQAALPNDIQLRTLGLRRAAWATWVALDDRTRGMLKAYSDGVNAWMGTNTLPPEYDALELLSADPWNPVDSLAIGKILAFQLSFDLNDIDLTIQALAYQQAGEIGGFNGGALFTEDTTRIQPPDDRVTVPGFLSSIGGAGASEGTATAQNDKGVTDIVLDYELGEVNAEAVAMAMRWREQIQDIPLFETALDSSKEGTGSNAWVVSGEHTENGEALFANDPHLSLGSPSVFIEERITVTGEGGYSAGGVGFSGIPGIVQGCTDNFCWGTTTNPMDVTDVYQEQLLTNNLGQPTHTVFQGQPERLRTVFQSYFVNSVDGEIGNVTRANVGLDAGGVTFIVPRRNNGPIVQVDGDTGLSVQYAGWGPTFEIVSFLEINRASNLAEFEDALQLFDVGSQNFMYADNDGNIAHFVTGEMPIRADLQDDMMPAGGVPPWLIRDGTGQLNHEWLGVRNPQPQQILPYEILTWDEMPKAVNPAQGYLANANNDPIGTTLDNNALNQVRPGGGLYYLNQSYSSYRMGRIDRELQALLQRGSVNLQDMIDLQANNQLRDAEELAPFIVNAFANAVEPDAWPGLAAFAADSRLFEVALRLGAWDFSTPTGIQAGFDAGDDPLNLPEPTMVEIDHSVAATLYSAWRAQMLNNTVDGVLSGIGLGDFLPDSREAWDALAFQLRNYEQTQGVGASGIPFFNVPNAPDANTARDVIILQSMVQALDLLASDEFAPAFGNSEDLGDYRWGRLHRIVFDHPLGIDPFNVPNGGGFTSLDAALPGVARGGGYEAVDASRHSSRADGLNEFMFSAGPARRAVSEMGEGGQRLEVIPGGRSGVFLSPAYSNQLPLWLTNQYHELP
ncbi:MAG: penicillin acylase family protein [Xanthomonadales bacterium]|nr:penicillin acylase family protein [Xanthomonadales bacterium]